MKNIYLIIPILFIFMLSCRQEDNEEKSSVVPKIEVKLTSMTKGYLPDYLELQGTTVYLNKSNIIAPISGYVITVNIKPGDKIKKGDLLFKMQTPEAYVLAQKDTTMQNMGIVKVYAPVSGHIANLNILNSRVFADKGALMCQILASGDLKVQVNVPFEYNKYIKIGNKCKVILPDSTLLIAMFSKILPQVDRTTQTEKVLANIISDKIFLPEYMIVKVMIDKSVPHQAQILPKSCVQTNALMTKYWVMRLINDTTAVQTFVTIGTQTHNKVEILSPQFEKGTLFISEGAYGLSDTVYIEKTE